MYTSQKAGYRSINYCAIAVFYVIAIALRLIVLLLGNKFPDLSQNIIFGLATGVGPLVGAIAAMLIFKRKSEYTLFGKSVWRSVATVFVPCLVFGIIGGLEVGYLCLMAFVYGLFEEVGWRGFLQNELKEIPFWQSCLIITLMWLLWHCDLDTRNLLFFVPLLLGASFGIGKIVTDTHSILFCAAFHGIINFVKRGLLSDTSFLIAFICIIIFWSVIWYFVKKSTK